MVENNVACAYLCMLNGFDIPNNMYFLHGDKETPIQLIDFFSSSFDGLARIMVREIQSNLPDLVRFILLYLTKKTLYLRRIVNACCGRAGIAKIPFQIYVGLSAFVKIQNNKNRISFSTYSYFENVENTSIVWKRKNFPPVQNATHSHTDLDRYMALNKHNLNLCKYQIAEQLNEQEVWMRNKRIQIEKYQEKFKYLHISSFGCNVCDVDQNRERKIWIWNEKHAVRWSQTGTKLAFVSSGTHRHKHECTYTKIHT